MSIPNSNESRIRDLGGAASTQSAEDVDAEHGDPDTTLRTDGEKDTLYDDGLDLEDDSQPLTGVDGKDDSVPGKDRR